MLTRVHSSIGHLLGSFARSPLSDKGSSKNGSSASASASASGIATSELSSGSSQSSRSRSSENEEVVMEFLKMLHDRVSTLETSVGKTPPVSAESPVRAIGTAACQCAWNTCTCFFIRACVSFDCPEEFVREWVHVTGSKTRGDIHVEWISDAGTVEAIVWSHLPVSLNLAAVNALASGADDVEISPLRVPEYLSYLFGLSKSRVTEYRSGGHAACAAKPADRPWLDGSDPLTQSLAKVLDGVESKLAPQDLPRTLSDAASTC